MENETEIDMSDLSIVLSIRADPALKFQLEDIALFEHMGGGGVSALVRKWIVEEVHRYERNPQFIRFKKELGERQQHKRQVSESRKKGERWKNNP
jgi:hypothetical protein